MQAAYDEFEKLGVMVVAVAQEETDLEAHGRMLKNFKDGPRFDVVADLNRERTTRYDHTTAYLIDQQGIVRQIFPMMIHARPSWRAILNEIKRLAEAP